ncbi:hypothetical protein niasHT_039092 [Heterodera trifolii]|uniref:B30.2/SPRY domain-containing protein n=1 Tax=Heterodera trifolii TaxID=157864 RepID=A0ABD2ITL2_9BILA
MSFIRGIQQSAVFTSDHATFPNLTHCEELRLLKARIEQLEQLQRMESASVASSEVFEQNGNDEIYDTMRSENGEQNQGDAQPSASDQQQLKEFRQNFGKMQMELRETIEKLVAKVGKLEKQQQRQKNNAGGFTKVTVAMQQNCWDGSVGPSELEIIGAKRLMVQYKGNRLRGSRSMFTKRCILSTNSSISYVEVKIITMKICSLIGFASKEMPLYGRVGTYPNSYGHRSDGLFWVNGYCQIGSQSAKFGIGDVVGCGIILATREIFFTKNGHRLDSADFVALFPSEDGPLFACVTLHDSEDKIEANFGPDFKFNLNTL